jgi:hypothetical protein
MPPILKAAGSSYGQYKKSPEKLLTFVSGIPYNNLISPTKGYKMPNWVFNGLTIEGNPEQVKSLIKQMNKPFIHSVVATGDLAYEVKQTKYVNPIFAFHNIYNYRDAGITDEVYHGQPPRYTDFSQAMKFDTNDWYNFNVREWGTKWDVAVSEDNKYPDTTIEEAENGENYVVHYNFNTAWSRAMPAISKLSAQYPTLLFTLSYEEETGWGGECEFLRGEVISESEWDNQCRECDGTDCVEYNDEKGVEVCQKCGYES